MAMTALRHNQGLHLRQQHDVVNGIVPGDTRKKQYHTGHLAVIDVVEGGYDTSTPVRGNFRTN